MEEADDQLKTKIDDRSYLLPFYQPASDESSVGDEEGSKETADKGIFGVKYSAQNSENNEPVAVKRASA